MYKKKFSQEISKIKKTKNGYLKDSRFWDRKIAILLAKEESILLTKEHWDILFLLRNYYIKYQIHPSIRYVIEQLQSKKSYLEVMKELYNLFPKGPINQGFKIAGLPKPKKCYSL